MIYSNLPISTNEIKTIESKMEQMSLYGGISVRIVQSTPEKVVVRVEQMNLRLGIIFNKKELAARARKVIEPILGKVKIFYWPIVFQPKVGSLDLFWLKSKMEEYQLKITDLANQFSLEEDELANVFTGNLPLTKMLKSAFFYFFHTLDMNEKMKEVV
ncbi:MAG: hypothetical protein ACPG6V_01110 [Flavobacteriales bacterium]